MSWPTMVLDDGILSEEAYSLLWASVLFLLEQILSYLKIFSLIFLNMNFKKFPGSLSWENCLTA